MAWIESHQEIWRHPKTKKLARLLKISVPTAVGYLHGLWYWAMDFAQDGDISKYDPEDIADAVLWDDPADMLLNAFVEAGFVDVYKRQPIFLTDLMFMAASPFNSESSHNRAADAFTPFI